MEIFEAAVSKLGTYTHAQTVRVTAHGFNIENLGNTIARISGYNPIEPSGFLIVPNYADFRVFRNEFLLIEFDLSNLEGREPINKIVIHVDKIKGFPYPYLS